MLAELCWKILIEGVADSKTCRVNTANQLDLEKIQQPLQ